MSDLIRCDKCKKELPERVIKKRRLFSDLHEYKNYWKYTWDGRYIENDTKNHTRSFHLCDNCKNDLFKWLEIELEWVK
jgi:hypothetical protein